MTILPVPAIFILCLACLIIGFCLGYVWRDKS
jgi:hypothetical protein